MSGKGHGRYEKNGEFRYGLCYASWQVELDDDIYDYQSVRLLVSASLNQPANSVFLSQKTSISQPKPAPAPTSEQASCLLIGVHCKQYTHQIGRLTCRDRINEASEQRCIGVDPDAIEFRALVVN